MKNKWIWVVAVLIVVCGIQAVLLMTLRARGDWQQQAAGTDMERGRAVAERMGCFGCHGPGGTSPTANPGAVYGEVPGWGGDTWMLWSNKEDDIRAWILEGHPPRRAPDRDALISMPAYERHLDSAELDDLVAYVLAVSRFGQLGKLETQGREIAVRMGCFGCHGPEGRGLVWNPGSFKGYIPAWDSADHAELVQDDDEFRQWVRFGISDRLGTNPAARALFETQAIRMPAYDELLDEEELEALLAYVKWVRDNPRRR